MQSLSCVLYQDGTQGAKAFADKLSTIGNKETWRFTIRNYPRVKEYTRHGGRSSSSSLERNQIWVSVSNNYDVMIAFSRVGSRA